VSDVLVVGCGLIGTSVALALRGARDVTLHDTSSAVLSAALGRGAGRAWDGREAADLVVVAVPPAVTAAVLSRLQQLDIGGMYTHVASVQSHVQAEVEMLNCDQSSVVGGHPLAGRETSGPSAARADLFGGRPWALCPSEGSSPQALAAVRRLVQDCGGVPVEVTAAEHDAAVARLSHLPQVVASALAGMLVVQEPGGIDVEAKPIGPRTAGLSGPGLADTTRLAASDAALWTEILRLNAPQVAPVVRALADELLHLHAALQVLAGDVGSGAPGPGGTPDSAAVATQTVEAFLRRGNAGRALVPVKRGGLSDAFAPVGVVVDDTPGRLGSLFAAAGAAQVNVEDVRVEHLPGRPTGVIELLVATDAVGRLRAVLARDGWRLVDGTQ
jgi:prephenate dehydrogenase